QELVCLQSGLAENLRQPAGGDPSIDLHLPESVLGMSETQPESGLIPGGSPDMRDGMPVSQDLHRSRKRCACLDLAIYVGQGGAGGKVERPNHRRGNSEKPKENSQYPTHARSPIFNREALSDSPLLGRENKKPAVAGSRMPGTARPSGDRDLPPDSRNVR